MTIFTRRGDSGDTSLADGTRVSKAALRVEAFGAVDEANSIVGLARGVAKDAEIGDVLRFAQHRLLNCTSSLAMPDASTRPAGTSRIVADDVAALEAAISRFEQRTPKLTGFIVEGGSETACRLHAARAVTRRAERRVVALHAESPVDPNILAFINRLSDTLFAAARLANTLDGAPEEPWDPETSRPEAEA